MSQEILKKQHYTIIGEHSATKLCYWVAKKLLKNDPCYKEQFYGIQCHRCIQMAPSVSNCTQSCLFCWRYRGFTSNEVVGKDDPEIMADKVIEAQKKLVSGFKGDPRCDENLWKEARDPKHVAISLAGEPTMYEHLSELIASFRRRGLTTFLVTNGTLPGVLENLDPLPDQLYVTVAAPNEETYKKLCIPLRKENWENLKKTIELLPSLNTRKVIRHTLVKGYNMDHVDGYSRLDKTADPDFIECKAYMFVGYSRYVMSLENMPSHDDIRAFSGDLSQKVGYEFADEKKNSRVTLLHSGSKKLKL